MINSDLNCEFGREIFKHETIRRLIEDAEWTGIALDADTLEFTLRHRLEHLARKFEAQPEDLVLLEQLMQDVILATELPFSVQFQQIQNIHYQLGQNIYPKFREKADREVMRPPVNGWLRFCILRIFS